jgi:hypothetical protein
MVAAAVVGLLIGFYEAEKKLEVERLQAQAALAAASRQIIQLDLTPAAMDACKRLFVRHTQGGAVSDYRCILEGNSITIYGPNWRKAQGDDAPIEDLGREVLK